MLYQRRIIEYSPCELTTDVVINDKMSSVSSQAKYESISESSIKSTVNLADKGYSIGGNSLVIMIKAGYIWRSDNKGESVEIPLSALSETDYDDRELDRQLYEIVYKNGVYYHIRVERGFHPREYLEDIYKDMTGIES